MVKYDIFFMKVETINNTPLLFFPFQEPLMDYYSNFEIKIT